MVRIAKSSLLALGLLAAPLWTACDDESPRGGDDGAGGGGGEGGAGGSGGVDEQVKELCERTCSVLVSCTREYAPEEEEACVQTCGSATPQASLMASCLECLESVECSGASLGCRSGPACDMAFDLRVSGKDLTELEGETVRVLVVEAIEGEAWIDFARDVTVTGGGFDLTFEGGLPAWGIPFDVVVLADGDRDGACTAGTGDAAWRYHLGLPIDDVHVEVAATDRQTPSDCELWAAAPVEIVLEGSGFSELEGTYVIAASVWVDPTFLSVSEFVSSPIEDGAFRLEFGRFGDYVEELAPNSEIRLAWMVDLDGDWTCTDADAGGSVLLPKASGIQQRAAAGPSEPGTAPCSLLRGLGHDVRLAGDGYDDFEGDRVAGALLDTDGYVVAAARAVVTGGELELLFPGYADHGSSYTVAVWIDADGDYECAVPSDAGWIVPVGAVDADLTQPVPFQAEGSAEAAVCNYLPLRPGSGAPR